MPVAVGVGASGLLTDPWGPGPLWQSQSGEVWEEKGQGPPHASRSYLLRHKRNTLVGRPEATALVGWGFGSLWATLACCSAAPAPGPGTAVHQGGFPHTCLRWGLGQPGSLTGCLGSHTQLLGPVEKHPRVRALATPLLHHTC